MGIPHQYLVALQGMFSQLRRVLEHGGEIGPELASTTGVPEGCAMSIVAMTALSAWAASILQCTDDYSNTLCIAYADNWVFLADTIGQLQTGLDKLHQFICALKMKIAPDKSWSWATHAKQRAQLQSLSLDGQSVPIRHVANELGCDVSYCKRGPNAVSKAVSKTRLQKNCQGSSQSFS